VNVDLYSALSWSHL